ncbi:unnamed protein product [Ambrosiozyma monospora]|uniref:Unnamed protein product n=1 Tax=Ambrosiozyma monospora TaxID=43982 RepID=A0ACB5STU0_AMBMO|nr:unnamed protein product [Ambrosiozyma monospora]
MNTSPLKDVHDMDKDHYDPLDTVNIVPLPLSPVSPTPKSPTFGTRTRTGSSSRSRTNSHSHGHIHIHKHRQAQVPNHSDPSSSHLRRSQSSHGSHHNRTRKDSLHITPTISNPTTSMTAVGNGSGKGGLKSSLSATNLASTANSATGPAVNNSINLNLNMTATNSTTNNINSPTIPIPTPISNQSSIPPEAVLRSNTRPRTTSLNMKSSINANSTITSPPPSASSAGSGFANETTTNNNNNTLLNNNSKGLTLWQMLKFELDIGIESTTKDSETKRKQQDAKTDESSKALLNFIQLPIYLENFMAFGIFYSAVVFLKWTVVIPLRSILHLYSFMRFLFLSKNKTDAESELWLTKFMRHKSDFLTMVLVGGTLFLLKDLDSSRIYHNIRAGTAVKLYFMVGLLDIADKLLSSTGQDITKLLFHLRVFNIVPNTPIPEKEEGTTTASSSSSSSTKSSAKIVLNYQKLLHFSLLLAVTVIYLTFHAYVIIFQIMALNVAINSYSNALLTLILSAQFAELKSAVFKRMEREGLFQIACADLNERFQLILTIIIVSSRNLLQMFTSGSLLSNSLKPRSWSSTSHLTIWSNFNDWFGFLMGPMFIVIGSEILVDWMKHAYINKFNLIQPSIYKKYMVVLAKDYVNSFKSVFDSKQNSDLEVPDPLSKRTGLPIITIVIVFLKMTVHPWLKYYLYSEGSGSSGDGEEKFSFVSLVALLVILVLLLFLRSILSLILLKWSNRILRSQSQTQASASRAQPATKPNFNKPPLSDYVPGIPNVTLTDVGSIRKSLYDQNEAVPASLEEVRVKKALKKKDNFLENVNRFEMHDKRIW